MPKKTCAEAQLTCRESPPSMSRSDVAGGMGQPRDCAVGDGPGLGHPPRIPNHPAKVELRALPAFATRPSTEMTKLAASSRLLRHRVRARK